MPLKSGLERPDIASLLRTGRNINHGGKAFTALLNLLVLPWLEVPLGLQGLVLCLQVGLFPRDLLLFPAQEFD